MPRITWRGRTGWRLRAATDSPRPAGRRRWTGRLGRSGFFTRRGLRVNHRHTQGGALTREVHQSRPNRFESLTAAELTALAPVSPAPTDPLAGVGAVPPASAGAMALLPGERTVARQLRFGLVNLCTLASLGLGLLAILLAMRGEVQAAAGCLIACVIFDGLDGALARRLGVASPFGAQMDSLADMCAFGMAAPVVVYASVVGSVPAAGAAVACALVAGCAAIRLARFNVSPKDTRFFSGIPTTMAAGVLALAVLIELPLPPVVLLMGVALLAFAMVSSFPYAKLARLLRLPPWLWLAPLAGVLVDARLTFVAVVVLYLLSGPVLWLHRRRSAPVTA